MEYYHHRTMMDKSINGCRYSQGCKIICTFVLCIGKCMSPTDIPPPAHPQGEEKHQHQVKMPQVTNSKPQVRRPAHT